MNNETITALTEGRAFCDVKMEDYINSLEGLVADVSTQLNQKCDELRENQLQLVMQEKMASLGNLAAGVAHEINNPAGVARSTADTLRRSLKKLRNIFDKNSDTIENSDKEYFNRTIDILYSNAEITISSIDRIAKVIKTLKEFARLDEANYKVADIHEGIENTIRIAPADIFKNIDIEKKFGHIPQVRCYPKELNQVFMNLLLNAAHSIENHGKITICTSMENNQIKIKISDTGRGIKPEYMDKIFNPGFTTKGSGVGTGLGLSISYNIIKKHNGTINVDSVPGKGTTITISLPVSR